MATLAYAAMAAEGASTSTNVDRQSPPVIIWSRTLSQAMASSSRKAARGPTLIGRRPIDDASATTAVAAVGSSVAYSSALGLARFQTGTAGHPRPPDTPAAIRQPSSSRTTRTALIG